MTDDRYADPSDPRDLECLDPALGEQMWQREAPDCPPALRERLEAHLAFCAACRLQVAVEARTIAGLRDGTLHLEAHESRQPAAWLGIVGAAAVAAGLALTLTLTPRPAADGLVLRGGDDEPAIERPVPGEVIHDRRPTLRWTALEGASSYQVRVAGVEDGFVWSTETEAAEATIPADLALPADTRFRVSVTPVPAHLAPAGGLRTSFRTGGLGAWLGYRLGHGNQAGRATGLAGIVALVVALVVGWRRR